MIKYACPPPPRHRPYFLAHNRIYRRCCLARAAHRYFLVYDEEKLCWRVKLCADCENCIISLPAPPSTTHKYIWTLTLFENVICFSSPFSTGLLRCTSHAESHALAHPLSHTHTHTLSLTHTHAPNQFLCSSCWVCILFPEVLISCLASRPALPSSLCPLCPERSGGQPTLPLDWRLFLLHINRSRSIYCTLMKILLYYMEAFLYDPPLHFSVVSLHQERSTCWI